MTSLYWLRLILGLILFSLAACSPSARINKQAKSNLLHSADLKNAHVGIAIYDATQNKWLYKYQSNKYFVPASNTKLLSCYAALKYLGDSLTGIFYKEDDTAVYLLPSGDPTLLHKDFSRQPVIQFLQSTSKKIYITSKNWRDNALGFGWSWDDYNSDYMAERSPLPVYGNVVKWIQEIDTSKKIETSEFSNTVSISSVPEINWRVRFNPESAGTVFLVRRNRDENEFIISEGKEIKKEQDVPFLTRGILSAIELLEDTIGKAVSIIDQIPNKPENLQSIHSQPLDSFLLPMMHRSDNFFAEQSLLMVSQDRLQFMSIPRLIDTLLKTDLQSLPQRPRWVDGSGLSRYNQFTPEDFVWILNKMKDEFGIERMKGILPTGGEGTLSNYFKNEAGFIFAKTGTLSGHVALSGMIFTKRDHLLIFSLLVNNHNGSAVAIRRQTEAFLQAVRERH